MTANLDFQLVVAVWQHLHTNTAAVAQASRQQPSLICLCNCTAKRAECQTVEWIQSFAKAGNQPKAPGREFIRSPQ